MGVVATTRVSVIVLVVGFIGAVSETGFAEDGGDIYSFFRLLDWDSKEDLMMRSGYQLAVWCGFVN